MAIEIRELDRFDEVQVRTFWGLERDAVADRPYNTFTAWEAARTYIPMEFTDRIRHFAAAWDGDTMVGALAGGAPLTDNTHRAHYEVAVLPEQRRRGIGTRLADQFEQWAIAHGRRVIAGEVFVPVEGSSPALAFALRRGFRVTIEDGMKVADIASTRDTWAGLAAECSPYHQDYELRTVWSPIPEDLVAGHNAINNMFMSQAPSATPTSRTRSGHPSVCARRSRGPPRPAVATSGRSPSPLTGRSPP